MEGARDGAGLLPLGQDVGDVFAAEGLEAQGVQEGEAYFVRAVNLAQGDDLLDVMRGVEPFFLELAAVRFGLRAEIEERP